MGTNRIISRLRGEIYTTNDTFVGVIAGFIGACATILVGTQIYNSIDTRNTINKLNESFNSKIKEQNTSYDSRMRDIKVLNNKLTYELDQIKKELTQAKEERLQKLVPSHLVQYSLSVALLIFINV